MVLMCTFDFFFIQNIAMSLISLTTKVFYQLEGGQLLH